MAERFNNMRAVQAEDGSFQLLYEDADGATVAYAEGVKLEDLGAKFGQLQGEAEDARKGDG